MKKNLSRSFVMVATIFFMVLFYSNSFAEPYQNSKFPSTEIIEKMWKSQNAGYTFTLIGKFETQKDAYILYIKYEGKNSGMETISLKKLDTDIWIYKDKTILQK